MVCPESGATYCTVTSNNVSVCHNASILGTKLRKKFYIEIKNSAIFDFFLENG